MSVHMFGNSACFAISCEFFKETHETELAMYISGKNILQFKRDGISLTTRWDLDDLAEWLRGFLNNIQDDPYPVECEGKYAAIKDISAREFDSDDDDEFDEYYDRLDEWNLHHRWHPAANGAVLADLYFQTIGNQIEISWNNQYSEPGVTFSEVLGGCEIQKKQFIEVVDEFLKSYAQYWF